MSVLQGQGKLSDEEAAAAKQWALDHPKRQKEMERKRQEQIKAAMKLARTEEKK